MWEESNINWLDMHGRCGLNPSANPLEVFDIEYGKDPRLPVADNSGTDYKSTITFTITNE